MSKKPKQDDYTHGQQLIALVMAWQFGVTFQTALGYVQAPAHSSWDELADDLQRMMVEAQEFVIVKKDTRH